MCMGPPSSDLLSSWQGSGSLPCLKWRDRWTTCQLAPSSVRAKSRLCPSTTAIGWSIGCRLTSVGSFEPDLNPKTSCVCPPPIGVPYRVARPWRNCIRRLSSSDVRGLGCMSAIVLACANENNLVQKKIISVPHV